MRLSTSTSTVYAFSFSPCSALVFTLSFHHNLFSFSSKKRFWFIHGLLFYIHVFSRAIWVRWNFLLQRLLGCSTEIGFHVYWALRWGKGVCIGGGYILPRKCAAGFRGDRLCLLQICHTANGTGCFTNVKEKRAMNKRTLVLLEGLPPPICPLNSKQW